ncbi:MAG: hypothetical protein E6Q88_07445 [Lysobacteraceae bacterium]|nr:MAG: hypothetical protein E6Q88_07445 [Xanthomonadaceae bacterium]
MPTTIQMMTQMIRMNPTSKFSGAVVLSMFAFALGCPPIAVAAPQSDMPSAQAEAMTPEPVRQDLSYPLPAGMAIEVDNPYGSVYVRFGGYEHQFDMHTTLQKPVGAARIAFDPAQKEGRFLVAPRLPDGVALAEGQRLDLVLYVPQHHALSVRTDSGPIESRGVKSDLVFRSRSGDIMLRGTEGVIDVETGDGKIEAIITETAPPGSRQRLVSRTGSVLLSTTDKLDAEVRMSTSQTFATDFSLTVEYRDGQEPDKYARAVVGAPKSGANRALVAIESLVGEVRLQRRAVFVDPE